jgi:hypothetical protein
MLPQRGHTPGLFAYGRLVFPILFMLQIGIWLFRPAPEPDFGLSWPTRVRKPTKLTIRIATLLSPRSSRYRAFGSAGGLQGVGDAQAGTSQVYLGHRLVAGNNNCLYLFLEPKRLLQLRVATTGLGTGRLMGGRRGAAKRTEKSAHEFGSVSVYSDMSDDHALKDCSLTGGDGG